MAVSIFDENTPHDGTEYVAYDDSRQDFFTRASEATALASGSTPIDTTEIDIFRQGVEITTQAYRFEGPGAKIWSGNIKGFTQVRTLGQAVSWTEDQNSKAFTDQQVFNPLEYVDNEDYPSPIVFNDGPQGLKEASINVFGVPFSDSVVEDSTNQAYGVRGNAEDGNQDANKLNGANSRIRQFLVFGEDDLVPFLDDGQLYYGDTISTSIIVEGFLNDGEAVITPFNDRGNDVLIDQLSTNNDTLKRILGLSSSLNLDDDIRGTHGVRSTAAGGDVYGPGQAQYGTDSIAFSGFFRGS